MMVNTGNFDLQSLRLFLLAAESGSLTKAASQSNITLSAASKRIAELEKNFECRLFIRQPRGLELTAAGQGAIRHTRKLLDNVNQMASEISDYSAGILGHIRVAANVSAVIQFLPQDLAGFQRENPRLRILLEEALSENIVEQVDSGRVDIGIFADNVAASGIRTFTYRQDRLVLLVPSGHPLASFPSISFTETLGYNYVGLNQGSSLLRRISDEAISAGKILKVNMQVTSFDALCRMIQAELGIGILPSGAISHTLHGKKLVAIPLTDSWAHRTLKIGINAVNPLQPEAKKLLNFLRCVK
ncbi:MULTISPECIES: LysR family transcriptional regulator [Enterobacteriaceae]|uniref:LysR family transcriptional regulator n=1 Tax=Enterobacteriaceae TaxID=543 RepID=UPI00226B0139|nr:MULTISPECIES: LysR family transcriptional regulator [Enterobacteriaceae]MCX9044460.1 LysR family transcriptional regulator [Citrobacter portucalensis]MDA8491004.1 LysR family transcriptional regulator [Kluyvera sp. Awk 3]